MAEQDLKLEKEEGGSNKKLIIIIAAVAVVVVVIAVAVTVVLMSGGKAEPEVPVVKNIPGEPGPDAEEIHYLTFEKSMMIQLPVKPRDRMLQVKVAVSTKTAEEVELAKTHSFLIASVIDNTLALSDPSLYINIQGRNVVKKNCLEAVQNALNEETGQKVVNKIYFTDFVMQ